MGDASNGAELAIVAQLAREPVPGHCKTRLSPALSAKQAAALHEALLEYMVASLAGSEHYHYQLWIDGDPAAPVFQRCLERGVSELAAQTEGDLGQRMAYIANACLMGAPRVVLLGSDAPAIDREYLMRALDGLQAVDAVIGPALDGGYVLLGLRRFDARLFQEIEWGGERVLAQTMKALESLGWSYILLKPLADIDRPEDLRLLPDALKLSLPQNLTV
jgi:rSAM/selenodomain-associated transferase 1